jgi:phenylacetate-CoA ligase
VNGHAILYRAIRGAQGDRRFALLEELRASERWSPARVQAAREARLRQLLHHAFEHVPFYREPLLESGVVTLGTPVHVDLSRFARLPVLTRTTVRTRADQLVDRRPATVANPRRRRFSGGTTGGAVWVVQDRVARESSGAVTLWFDEWSGHVASRSKVVLWELPPRTPGRP